jgi:ABC-type nickel/cobalt efflux system permease component RcnA
LIHTPGGPQSGVGLLGLRARRRRLLPATEATKVDDQPDHEGEDDPADHERPSVHKASLHPRIRPIGGSPCCAGSRRLASLLSLTQHPDEHSPECPILLAVDQEFGEGASRGHVAEACREQLQPSSLSGFRTGESGAYGGEGWSDDRCHQHRDHHHHRRNNRCARDHLLRPERIASVAASTGLASLHADAWVAPELTDPVGAVEVREHQDVE